MKDKIHRLVENSPLFFSILSLLIFLFTVATSFNGLYGQDAHEYFRYTKALHVFFTDGKNPGDYFFPLFYPLCGALVSFLMPSLIALQFISITSFIITCCFIEKIIALVFDADRFRIRVYLLLFFFLSPFMLRSSVVVMSDMFCVMWVTISLFAFVKYSRSFKPVYFMMFVIAAAAAVMTRYAAAVVLVIPAILIGIVFLKRFNLNYFFLTVLAALFIIVPHILIRQTNPVSFLHHPWLERWSPVNFFKTSFDTVDGHSDYTFPNVIYSVFGWIHPGYIFPGAILILFFRKKNIQPVIFRVLLWSALAYSVFIAGIPYQNMRFLQLAFPVILVLLFPSAMEVFGFFSNKINGYIVLFSIAAVQLILFVRAFFPFYNYNHLEKAMANEVKKYPANTVYTFEMESALQSYHVENKIVGLWNQKLDSVEAHSLLLFNNKKFESQWKGKNVMLNYEMIIQRKKIKPLKNFDNGWQLSELD